MKRKSDITILYEDDYLFAINKPARVASVPAEGINLPATILGKVQRKFEGQGFTPYLLHRLDMDTSGVLLFGKHERDREALESIFRHDETTKKYVALVKGVPSGKIITKPLDARHSDRKVFAQTSYKVLQVFKHAGPLCALVEAEIKMGRKHQIRQHFAMIGHPILLDRRYGDEKLNRKFRIHFRLGRQFLHAAQITFLHPILRTHMKIEAPLTKDLQSVIKKLHFPQ